MGFYINPSNETKEQFLERKGIEVPLSYAWESVEADMLPVVLVDNRIFTAAGICYCKRELEVFTDPGDARPRRMYLVSISDLLPVSNLETSDIRK